MNSVSDRKFWPSKKEAAARLGVSPRTIERQLAQGKLQGDYRCRPGARLERIIEPGSLCLVEGQSATSRPPEAPAPEPQACGVSPSSDTLQRGAASKELVTLALKVTLESERQLMQNSPRPRPKPEWVAHDSG